jgi:hypothetical protein
MEVLRAFVVLVSCRVYGSVLLCGQQCAHGTNVVEGVDCGKLDGRGV